MISRIDKFAMIALLALFEGTAFAQNQQGQSGQSSQQQPPPSSPAQNPTPSPPLNPKDSSSRKQPAPDESNPQAPNESTSRKPSSTAQSAEPETGSDDKSKKESANYDPFPAVKDVEIGEFYMHKGDLDAAISRFEEAIQLRPNFAQPRLLLGEVYEKKGEKDQAVKYYKEYLQVFPHAPDAKKIEKKIEKLSSE